MQTPTFPARAVLTLALGKPLYTEMAFNLARSFLWWHRESDIQFFLATDRADPLPPDLQKIQIIKLHPGQYGQGFSPKLSLDLIAPAPRTLFVDADCLCVGKLDTVFARFAGHAVSVVGGSISEGEWFGDVAAVCRKLGVTSLPKFNGGIYYLERGEVARQVYARARELVKEYDQLGLVRMRGSVTDELLMAMAMATYQLAAIPDDGSILGDPQACPGPLTLDVIKGGSRLVNPPLPSPQHQAWYPFREVSPVVVHFLANSQTMYQYRSETFRLRHAFGHPVAGWLASLYAALAIRLPGRFWVALKPRLRRMYRTVFGVRAIHLSERI